MSVSGMKIPITFHSGNTTLWAMDDRVAVFSVDQAKIVFMHCPPEMQVWGIHNGKAEFLSNFSQALEFFKETRNESGI